MWEYGYDIPFVEDGQTSEFLGECRTLSQALSALYEEVEIMAKDAESYQDWYYEPILAEIRTYRDDPGFVDDPDMWEDLEFPDEYGCIVFYVIEV